MKIENRERERKTEGKREREREREREKAGKEKRRPGYQPKMKKAPISQAVLEQRRLHF